MLERLIHAAISTAIIIVAVPLVGMLIEFITMEITRGLAKHMGVSTALFIMNGLTFVGTVHHELSHALYALITGAKVTNVEVFKPKDDRLGCVEFIPRGNWFTKALQMTLSGIAPTVQGFLTLCLLFWLFLSFVPHLWWTWAIFIYLVFSIFIHMTMSTADVKAAIKGLPIVMALVFIICFAVNLDLFGMAKDAYISLSGLKS